MNPEKSVLSAICAAVDEAAREAADIWVANRLASPIAWFFRRKAAERFCVKAGFADGLVHARRLALEAEGHEAASSERRDLVGARYPC